MNTRTALRLLSPALFVASVGCAAAPPQPALQVGARLGETRSWDEPLVGVEAFFEAHELDEIEFDDDLEEIFGEGIDAVERDRVGLRVTVGTDLVRVYVQVFSDEIDDFGGDDLTANTALAFDDMYGIGAGARGEIELQDVGAGSKLIATYRLGFNLVGGEGNFMDGNPGTLLDSPDENGDFFYFEQEIQGGIGLDVYGLRPTVGAYASILSGLVEDDVVADDDDDDLRFEAFNAGLFLELRYQHPDSPLRVGVRGTAGDVEGVEVFLGILL